MKKDLLSCAELTVDDLNSIIELSQKLKKDRGTPEAIKPLAGKSIGMIFAKSSTRTRVSFEVGIQELGGYPVVLDQGQTQMGRGETIPDTAHVLERYLQGIVIRTYKQSDVEGLAQNSRYPVINALTDEFHPCQALTDIFTMWEYSRGNGGCRQDGGAGRRDCRRPWGGHRGHQFRLPSEQDRTPWGRQRNDARA